MKTKTCSSCKAELPATSFYKNRSQRDGLGGYCKKCQAEYSRTHAEENKKYSAKYISKNKHIAKRRRLKLANMVDEYKTSRGCAFCGEKHPACLVFHHRNPENKTATISNGLHGIYWGEKKLIAEMVKCDVLCANCHRKLHFEERRNKAKVGEV